MTTKAKIVIFSIIAFLLSYWTGLSFLGSLLEAPAYYLASLVFEKK